VRSRTVRGVSGGGAHARARVATSVYVCARNGAGAGLRSPPATRSQRPRHIPPCRGLCRAQPAFDVGAVRTSRVVLAALSEPGPASSGPQLVGLSARPGTGSSSSLSTGSSASRSAANARVVKEMMASSCRTTSSKKPRVVRAGVVLGETLEGRHPARAAAPLRHAAGRGSGPRRLRPRGAAGRGPVGAAARQHRRPARIPGRL
jgi:hypothetical protein